MYDTTIVLAGATGNLGGRIARALIERSAALKALVRHGSAPHVGRPANDSVCSAREVWEGSRH